MCLAKLPRVTHAPMLAAAIKNGQLLIAMAENYTDDDQKKRKAELLLYNRQTRTFKQKQLEEAIQSIAMDGQGDWLVFARRNGVQVIKSSDMDNVERTFYVNKNDDRIADADVTKSGEYLAFASAKGDLLRVHEVKEKLPFYYTHTLNGGAVKEIRFVDSSRILYSMDNGKVRHLDITGEVISKIPAQKFAACDTGYLENIAFDSLVNNIQ